MYATIDRTVYTTEQLVVIPDTVISDTWTGVENILLSDAHGESLYQDFSPSNAAFIDEASLLIPVEVEEDVIEVPAGTSTDSTETGQDETEEGGTTEDAGGVENEETTPEEVVEEAEPEVTPEPEETTPEPAAEPEPEGEVSAYRWGIENAFGNFALTQEVVEETTVTEEPVSEVVEETPVEEEVVVEETTEEAPEETETSETAPEEVVEETEESTESEGGEESSEEAESETDEEAVEEEEVVEEEEEIVTTIYDACAGDEECKLYSTTFTGFSMPEFESGTFLASAQLRLSLAAKTKSSYTEGPQRFVVEYTYESTGEWRTATVIDIDDEISNSINGDYFLVSLDKPLNQNQISNLQVRLSYQGNIADLDRAYVESLWLEVTSAEFYEETDPDYLTGAIDYSRDLEAPKFHELNHSDIDPALSELPSFTLSYSPQQNFLRRAFTAVFSENEYAVDSVRIIDAMGGVITVPVDVEYHDDKTWTVAFLEQPQKMVPGKYTVELTVNENDSLYTDTFEFYWGVLAVNTTKSMYFPGEDVTLNLAALTEKGDTICDARLELKIIDPTYAISEIPVEQSGSCGKNNVTDIPDYLAYFNDANELGRYTIQLQHLNKEGEVVHKIEDHFEVREYIPFDIERTAPTRIYPPAPYDVTLTVKANRVFTGDIVERVPRGFVFTETNGAEVLTMPEYTELVWRNVSLAEGDTLELSYQFDAPDISPYMYLLGPLNMDGFTELRQWQIASDALTAVGAFSGTRTVGSTNLNQTASPLQWSGADIDAFYYDHSTSTDSHEVTLRQSGDYFLAVTVPQIRTDANNSRTRVGIEVRVNGVAVPEGVGRSGYIRNQAGHLESSSHIHFLLSGVDANDVLEVYVEGLATIDAGDIVNVSGQASMYLEYMGVGAGVFAATTTQTTNSTDLNQTTEYPMSWVETRQDTGFVHSDSINPEQIVISNPGLYFVNINIPITGNNAQHNILGQVRLDGAVVPGGQFKQGYIQAVGTEGDGDGSIHWSGVVHTTTTNQVLTVGVIREARQNNVYVTTGFVGSIVMQTLPSTEVIVLRGINLVGGTNWNPAAAAAVQWNNRNVMDASVFSHSTTTNSHQITVNEDGDYLVSFNDALTSALTRSNSTIQILVNGTPAPGAQTKTHYVRNQNNHTESSGALVYLLRGIQAGDVVTVTTVAEAAAGTVNDTTDAIMMMWKKAAIDMRPDAPVTSAPFDNIRFASTTPFFAFSANDPDGTSAIEYEFSIATTTGFTASTTFNSAVDSEFYNTASSTDTSPFTESNTIRLQLTGGDALTDQTTYYWRVRARDVTGSGEYSDWSTTKSLTVDMAAAAPSWFQSYSGQFEGNSLVGTVSSGGDRVRVDASISPEVLLAYGEGTDTAPRYRFWNGTSWGVENSAQAVSGTINWVRTASGVARDEYALITLDSASDSFVQIYSASTSSWANRVLMSPVVVSPAYRGIAVEYESVSGDLMAVSCTNSPNPVYRIWNGSTWSATSTIPVSSLNNCNFLELAADPASDEMILVVRDTGTQYEALVWNGSAWVESRVIGSSAKVARQGMSVIYEASGDQAIVAVSNNTNNNFIYTTWNGTEFSTNAVHALGNDFEFGRLSADLDSDNIALCYIDEDNDIGVVRWNGGVWATAVELDTGGNADTARPVECAFETSAGRSDYLMAVYSDTTNMRYRAATSSVYSTEASVATIGDSFWVRTERAGDGKILTVALDDSIDNLLASVWNGSSWAAEDTLETNPSSVIAAPYEMYDMAAKRFLFSEGVVLTPPINFTDVPNQPTWGDINFSTTEPFGTDVQVRVKYSNVGTCDAYIPNLALPGNSGGFDISESPIDLVGVSTTTYSQICLEATLTTLGDESAALEEWTLAWVRQPKLMQNNYRWYVNGSFLTPTDVWPAGADDTAENTPLSSSVAININETIRLRLSLQGDNVELPAFSEAFKLQYAEGFTCSNTLTWHDVGGPASTTALWRGYENSIVGSDWYSASWGRRVRVIVDNVLVPANQTNFPIYLNLDDFPDAFFNNVQTDGDDIRITQSDGVTELPYELVTIDTVAKTGEIHFKASVSSTTDSSFFVYYGNSGASGYANNATYGRNNVWTNGFLAVYHLDQSPTASAPQYIDSTGNNTGTSVNMETGDRVASVVGRGIDIDGVDEHLTTNINQNMLNSTWSVWLRADGAQGAYDGLIMSRGTLTNGININSDGTRLGYHWRDAANTYSWNGGPVYPTNQWFMASMVVEPTVATMYSHAAGGVTSATNAVAHATATIDAFTVGRDPFGAARSFDGLVDEISLSNVVRSASWLTTTYNNKSNPTGFYDVSGEELIGDGRLLPSTLLTGSDHAETYEQENPTRDNQNTLIVGNDAEWDFVLQNNGGVANTNYCFRMVYEDGALLNSYQRYPRLITNAPPQTPVLVAPFDNERLASTSPWFEFYTDDELEDEVAYEIQVSTDYAFGSTVINNNSIASFALFTNLIQPAQKSQFTSGDTIQFISPTALSNGTTYWWRVRAQDPDGSGAYSEWSMPESFTVNTGTTITTWFQTTGQQFATNNLLDGVANISTNDTGIDSGFTVATTTSTVIDYDDRANGNAWGTFSFTNNVSSGSIRYFIEYRVSGETFALIPDVDLPGNSAGFNSSPVSLVNLNTTTYNELRLVAVLAGNATLPRLQDWTVTWSETIEIPTHNSPFDNAKVSSTTPALTFVTTDPENQDIQYEVQMSSSYSFTSSSTFTSGVSAGFTNTQNGGDTSPFTSGQEVQYRVQSALTNGNTYWWRVRARDPLGANTWSDYSEPTSFTVDTSITTSVWYQTTGEQFETDELFDIETTSGAAQITSTITEVVAVYGEGTGQSPQYRLWNGSSWSLPSSAQSVSAQIRWLELKASPTRPEYALGTLGTDQDVNFQIYNSETDSWSDMLELQTTSVATDKRTFNLAYESLSGDLLAIACNGSNAVYSIWNGVSWSATSSLTLTNANNCEFIQVASDPISDEMIFVFRHAIASANDFQAFVWNGSSFGNSSAFGELAQAAHEGMAVAYEESGGQAIVTVSNGANTTLLYNIWNGSSWSGTATHALGDHIEWATLKSDVGTDRLALCYIDNDSDLGVLLWSGSAWGTFTEVDIDGNDIRGRAIDCEWETGVNDGDLIVAYSDTTATRYQTYDTGFSGELTLSIINDTWEVNLIRGGDGLIHVAAYDDALTPDRIDHSRWDGSAWTVRERFSDNASLDAVVPHVGGVSMAAQIYPNFVSGSIRSTPIEFADGTGPRWDVIRWNDTTPGASDILYRLYYQSTPGVFNLVPDIDLPGNSTGFTTSPVDISNVNRTTYSVLQLDAAFSCDSGNCPTMQDWTVAWSEGITVSGIAREFNGTSTTTSGTVAVAVNGVLQTGKTGTILGNGTWSIANVTAFPGDTVTVFVDGATDSNESVGVATYDGVGNITGMELNKRHVTIGYDNAATTTLAGFAGYDNADDEDLFFTIGVGNAFNLCVEATCADGQLKVKTGTIFVPGATLTTHDFLNLGTFRPATNTVRVSGSWTNQGTFVPDTSSVIFSATSTAETITTATSTLFFYNATFGEGSGTATWSVNKPVSLTNNLTVSFGTLARGTSTIALGGNLQVGAAGYFSGIATTTFNGSGSHTWADAKAATSSSNVGHVVIDGATKTVTLAGNVGAESVTIGADDTLNASGSGFNINVFRSWTNNNAFIPQSGTVTFVGTSTGAINRGTSAFNNLAFTGVGGNWSFSTSTLALNGNLSIATGTVTLPTGTTTIGGSFTNTGGTFLHNNGEVRMTSTAGGRTISQSGTPFLNAFYDLVFAGSGSWSYSESAATTTRNFRIQSGTVTLPSGTLTVGGDYSVTGSGAFSHNNGEVILLVQDADVLRTNGSSLNNVRVKGGTGSWYNPAWSGRVPITVESDRVAENLTNFPIYVNLANLPSTFFTNLQTDGDDIRVTSADGFTEIPFELVTIDTVGATGELHFKGSLSSTTDTTFYIYHGNPSASGYATTSTYGRNNVWNNGFVAVYHMDESPTATAPQYIDSTGSSTGTTFNMEVGDRLAGQVGRAADIDGTNEYIGTTFNRTLSTSTWSVWMRTDGNQDAYDGLLFSRGGVTTGLNIDNTANRIGYHWNDAVATYNWNGGPVYPRDTWFMASLVVLPTEATAYVHATSGITSGTNITTHGNSLVNALNFGQDSGGGRFFNGMLDEVRISNVARSAGWLSTSFNNMASTTQFYTVSAGESAFTRTFTDTNATILGNLVIDTGGDSTFNTGTLSIGGSFTNNALFNANGGTVRFNSTAGAETIDSGDSSFATVTFDSLTGNFTVIDHATSTVAINLTNVQQFTLSSGRALTALGSFTHAASGASTTWTGSTLRLMSGTDMSINAKTHGGDVYGTLEAASSTLARMWNSSATSYVTSGTTGAIYSQDHATLDGDLYIFGNYTRSTGTEHWSYATDFDGTALTASTSRQVDVRIATSSQIGFVNASLNLVGGASASTTIDAQTGAFSLSATNTTMSARFFTASGTDAFGFRLVSSSTISQLQDGSFAVRAGRSALTLDSTTIDANPAAQFERMQFATTTAGAGTNVTVLGTPSSYVWFRNGTGNLYGEAFDNDPGGNPGNVRFDDSSYSVTVSGTVYSDDGTTLMGSPVCNNVSPVVTIAINGVPSFSGPCSSASSTYSISGVTYSGDAKIAVYLNTNHNGTTTTGLRSETTGFGTTTAGGVFTINKPANVQNGDYLVAITGKDDSVGITGPAGWTSYVLGTAVGNLRHTGIWYKLVTDASSEPANYTFTGDATEVFSYWIGALSGVSPTNPEDVSFTGRWTAVQNDTTPDAASLTTVTTNSFVLSAWYVDTDNAVTMPGAPWTTRAANIVSNEANNLSVSSRIMATAGATGAATITGVGATADTSMAQFAFRRDTATTSSVRAVTVTKTPSGNLTGLNLYQNRVIVRHEDSAPFTIADMTLYDFDNDTDMLFTAATGTPNTLRLPANTELYVFANKTFAPGGNITLGGSANANGYEGTLQIGSGATFTATGTETHTLAGRFVMATTSTFSSASSTFIFNATTTGKSITSPNTVTFNQVQFAGTGGGWNITAPLIVLADMNIASGTVTGTNNITLQNGSLYGNGVLSLGAGTTTIARSNTFGGTSAWTLNNLILGNGSVVGTTTPNTSATTTINGRLTISNAHFLDAGSSIWDLAGTGTVFTETGTFLEDTSTMRFSGAGSNVPSTSYYNLLIAAGTGSQTYTGIGSGILVLNNLRIGGGTSSIFQQNTNDPILEVRGNLDIQSNGTLQASNSGLLTVLGNYTNLGSFVGNNGTLAFTGSGTSEIRAGSSSFSNVEINGSGSYTVIQNATSSAAWSLINHANFTVNPSVTLAVGGAFLNNLAGSSTTFTNSNLFLYGTSTYEINDSATGDVYHTLTVGANSHIRMWNSSATTYAVNSTGSLYSQDHNVVNGNLYIWGALQRLTGDDFWSYSVDFDGTDLSGGSERVANVYFASGASALWGGNASLSVIGSTSATTTIQRQSSGTYGITIGGSATTEWNRVRVRDTNINGVVFGGTPNVVDFSRTDHLVEINSGTAVTVGGTVINANVAKNFTNNVFNVGGGATSPRNVTATGTALSSWRFTNHTGNIAGEAFDNDPTGDPGYVVWDDSAALITVNGNVYSDEGVTVSPECDGSTNNVRLVVAGLTTYDTTCNASTGAFSISGVAFSPQDTLTLFLNGETPKAANVSMAPISSIANMHLYHNRVIVRHENTDPITIAKMAVWDSSDDADIPFTAVDAGTDTLTLPANTKLLIWTGKTFEPNGNVTLSGGGASDPWDGTLEAQTNARFRAKGTETHSVGGSVVFGTGAEFVAASSTLTLTTSGSGRTFDVNANTLHNLTMSGSGSYTMSDATLTTTGSYAQSAGAVTFPTGTSTIGAAFNVTSGSFTNNGSPFVFTSTGAGNTVRFNNSLVASLRFTGSGSFNMTDTNATSSGSVIITAGGVTLPSGNFAVGGSFEKRAGSLTHNTSDIIMTSAGSVLLTASSSDLHAVRFTGGGTYTITDTNITFIDSVTVQSGTVLMASGTTAIGGSLIATSGTFTHATGTVLFNAPGTGRVIQPGQNTFYNLQIGAPAGGYTLHSATTTNNFNLASANIFTMNSGSTLTVGGVFTNSVGGVATTWTNSFLRLMSGTAYSINTRTNSGDAYATLVVGANTDVRSWYSSAATTTVAASASLYAQDHNNVNGALYIYGDLHFATTTEYWNYENDFDGTALVGGSRRAVSVYMAQNATTTVDSGTLQILGASGFETSIENQTTGTYSFAVNGGTLNANYYEFSDLNIDGVRLEGLSTITNLANGYFDLAVNTGSLITLSSTTLNANPSKIFDTVGFTATTGLSGVNVKLIGDTLNAWRFTNNYGNIGGEGFDIDGIDACGSIRFDNSSCLLTEQTHVRWRSDNGGEGAPNSEWYNSSFDYRMRVRVINNDNTAYATTAVKVIVPYDSAMQSDFEDLRFTRDNGQTAVPFWIERYTASSEAQVWVQVPVLPASGQAVVFMYYGSTTASSLSNGGATFTAFDDYEDNNITEYSGDTGLFTTVTSPVYGGTYALRPSNTSGRTTDGIFRFDDPVAQGQIIRYMQYVNTTAGSGDEPCTLFGVQSPGTTNQNYAVCLEQFGVDRISLSRNVADNDVSGTVLATSTVTYATGWYEVEIDWRTNNSIFVSLYNAAGTLVATTTATDSTYSSGGFGYSFWFQNGAWDSFTSRPRVATKPTVYLGVPQTDGGASWLSALDGPASAVPDDKVRLRVAIENSGLDVTAQQYRLEYAAKGAAPTCESVNTASYAVVPNQASCGSSPVCMQTSAFVSNGAPTTDLLFDTEGTFTPGDIVTSPSNETAAFDLDQDYYTEIEYVLNPTINAVDAYCFRVTNAGTPLDFYAKIAELGLQFDPTFGGVSLNGGLPISLTPGTTTAVTVTGTVTDFNGGADIVHATATIYRSGAGAACTPDNNNCYVASTENGRCTLTNCSGNSCDLTCSVNVLFHADPTDAETPYEGQQWLAYAEAEDYGGGYDFASAPGVELLTLRGMAVDSLINYGSLAADSNTGSFNPTTTVTNLGNVPINIDIEGTNLTDGGSSQIPADQQKVATSTFTYSACVTCQQLSNSGAVPLGINLNKPSVVNPPVETDVYWGIAVPFSASSAPHSGTNIFTPIGVD